MFDDGISNGTGAAAAASGPEDAKALTQATLDTPDRVAIPEWNPAHQVEPVQGGEREHLVHGHLLDNQLSPVAKSIIEGYDLLDRIKKFASRFMVLPSEAALNGLVLWIAHSHLMDSWFTSPRLAIWTCNGFAPVTYLTMPPWLQTRAG